MLDIHSAETAEIADEYTVSMMIWKLAALLLNILSVSN